MPRYLRLIFLNSLAVVGFAHSEVTYSTRTSSPSVSVPLYSQRGSSGRSVPTASQQPSSGITAAATTTAAAVTHTGPTYPSDFSYSGRLIPCTQPAGPHCVPCDNRFYTIMCFPKGTGPEPTATNIICTNAVSSLCIPCPGDPWHYCFPNGMGFSQSLPPHCSYEVGTIVSSCPHTTCRRTTVDMPTLFTVCTTKSALVPTIDISSTQPKTTTTMTPGKQLEQGPSCNLNEPSNLQSSVFNGQHHQVSEQFCNSWEACTDCKWYWFVDWRGSPIQALLPIVQGIHAGKGPGRLLDTLKGSVIHLVWIPTDPISQNHCPISCTEVFRRVAMSPCGKTGVSGDWMARKGEWLIPDCGVFGWEIGLAGNFTKIWEKDPKFNLPDR